MKPSLNQLHRTEQEWSGIAKESIVLNYTAGTLYAVGSELACLRLFYAFRYSGDRAKVMFSEPLKSWVFRFETDLE